MSGFDLSDLSGVVAEATFRWFFTFRPPEFSLAMRSAASFASLLGTVPVKSTDLPVLHIYRHVRAGQARILLDRGLDGALDVAIGGGRSSVTLRHLVLIRSLRIGFLLVSVGQLFRRICRLALIRRRGRRLLVWHRRRLRARARRCAWSSARRSRRALCDCETATQCYDQCKLIQISH